MINQRLMGIGEWSLTLREGTRQSVLAALNIDSYGYGHVIVTPTHMDPTAVPAATLLAVARYTGIYARRPSRLQIGGPGLAAWLADADGKGDVIEGTALSKSAGTFVQWITDLRPSSLLAGTYNAVGGALTMAFQYIDRRTALNYVADYFGAEWRINPDLTLDGGTAAQLFTTTPTVVVQRWSGGRDPNITGLKTEVEVAKDLEDYTTRIVLLANGLAAGEAVGTADISPATPYKDLQGNAVDLVRIIDSADTAAGNETAVAQAQLNRFTSIRRAVTLSSQTYDIGADIEVGDTIYVWDPERDLIDTANEKQYRGQIIRPIALRVLGYTWPVQRGMGVYFRDLNGLITDLTEWVQWESGPTTIEVGANPRPLDPAASGSSVVRTAALGPQGELGYAQVTANQGGITAIADLTNLTKQVTVGANRRIKITFHGEFASTLATDTVESYIFEGASQLQRCGRVVGATFDTHEFSITLTPSAGTHTYKARAAVTVGAGTATLNAAAGREAFLRIEDEGSAV